MVHPVYRKIKMVGKFHLINIINEMESRYRHYVSCTLSLHRLLFRSPADIPNHVSCPFYL